MSLFIGNISRSANERDIEKAFEKFGECHFRFRGAYGFVEYENDQDGEDAKEKLQGKIFGGMHINIGNRLMQNGARNPEDIIQKIDKEDLLEETEDPDLEEEKDIAADPRPEESNGLRQSSQIQKKIIQIQKQIL